MSRIGSQPILIPDGVDVTINDLSVLVKGPKGSLDINVHKDPENIGFANNHKYNFGPIGWTTDRTNASPLQTPTSRVGLLYDLNCH